MERKATEEKIPSLSFGMVIFPAHILAAAMRTSGLRDGREGEAEEARRDAQSDLFFRKRGDRGGRKERVGRWRRREIRGEENSLHLALRLIPLVDKTTSEMK